jgi:hypothetical protein
MSSIPASVSSASTDQLVVAVASYAAELAARPAPEHPGVCFEQAEALGRAADAVEAALAARVAVADRHGEPQRWGYPTATSWLRSRLGMRHSRADDRATLARQLDRLPQLAKRLAAEQISFGYASVIAGALRRLDDAEAIKGEEILLDLVDADCSVKEVAAAGDRIKQLIAERDGTEPEPEDGRRGERQWWTMSRGAGGRAFSKGLFGPELAELIRAKIEPLAKPTGPEDTRDHAQRMADALHTYLSEGGSGWDPILIIELKEPIWRPRNRRGSHPTDQTDRPEESSVESADRIGEETTGQSPATFFTGSAGSGQAESGAADATSTAAGSDPDVVTTPGDLVDPEPDGTGAVGATPAWATPDSTGQPVGAGMNLREAWELRAPKPTWPFDGTAFTARLPDGTPVPVADARRILVTAGFSALVLGTDGQPLYLGRRVRCATPHQRRVLNARYRTCVVVGCDIPANMCQLDHAVGWVNGDVSDVDKLAPLCHFHNKWKYEHPDRIHITIGGDGRYRYELIRPGRSP